MIDFNDWSPGAEWEAVQDNEQRDFDRSLGIIARKYAPITISDDEVAKRMAESSAYNRRMQFEMMEFHIVRGDRDYHPDAIAALEAWREENNNVTNQK